MSIESITNYIKVSERLASSGQPDDAQFKDISAAGYKAIINLAMPNSENAIPEEGNIVTALNMIYVHMPVPFEKPDLDHLRRFINIMRTLSDSKVWIHCVVNYRVSAFLFHYYRVDEGLSQEDAKKVMLPSWKPNAVWDNFLAISVDDIGL